MKICYILDFSVLNLNGPTINELEFINILEKQKKVDVCYFISISNISLFEKNKNNIFLFFDYQNKPFKLLPYYIVKVFLQFIKFYYVQKPDIIVTRLGPMPLLQYFISIFFGKKLFIKTTSRFWKITDLKHPIDKIYSYILSYINVKIMQNSAGLDTVTDNFKHIFEKKYKIHKNKISIISNAVNTSIFYPFKQDKKWQNINFSNFFPILGYVGNFPSQRGMFQLLDIYDSIKAYYPKVAVIIVGMDKELFSLQKEITNEKKNIFFLGQIPYSEVPKIMNVLDIGYSFTTNHDHKEIGNSSQKLRQYIACGKPVITLKDTNEFVHKNNLGSLVDPQNPQEIINETLKWIRIIAEEKDNLSQRLHQYAKENLSTEKTFKQRLAFWQKILDEK